MKEVRHRLPAAIDATLAEAVGLESLDELRDEIRQRMQRDYDNVARQRLKRALLDKLAERYDFPVPPGMVDMEFETIWTQYEGEREARRQIAARVTETRSRTEKPKEPRRTTGRSTPAMSSRRRKPLWRAPRIARRPRPKRRSRRSTRPTRRVTTRSRIRDPSGEPLDAAAIIAPEETALEGASDTEPAAPSETEDDREEPRGVPSHRRTPGPPGPAACRGRSQQQYSSQPGGAEPGAVAGSAAASRLRAAGVRLLSQQPGRLEQPQGADFRGQGRRLYLRSGEAGRARRYPAGAAGGRRRKERATREASRR